MANDMHKQLIAEIKDLKEKLEVVILERDELKRKLEWSEGEFSSLLKAQQLKGFDGA